ncbi:MAG: hypothetical protein GIW98_03485 [Candidatus Eremiobacteraeota bacterium]|nr:hypothetical protein [Candidatus Eremiobacteraeota bacterium]
MTETIECANEVCSCVITAEIETEEYCGDACREYVESGTESEVCLCGHPPCDVPP